MRFRPVVSVIMQPLLFWTSVAKPPMPAGCGQVWMFVRAGLFMHAQVAYISIFIWGEAWRGLVVPTLTHGVRTRPEGLRRASGNYARFRVPL
jgi:hypothetical protein